MSRGTFLPDSTLEWLPVPKAAQQRLLAHVHWQGPSGSALILMTCDGRTVSSHKSGGIDSVRSIRLSEAGDSALLVYYVSGHGTGWFQHSAAVLSLAHDSIAVLLDLVTEERSNSVAASGHPEDSTSVRWEDPGVAIRLGVRFTLRCDDAECRRTRGAILSEAYAWDGRAGRFVKQRHRG